MSNMKKIVSIMLSIVLCLSVFSSVFGITAFADIKNDYIAVYSQGTYHWAGVAMGGMRLTAYGADETTGNREQYLESQSTEYAPYRAESFKMSEAEAPVATYYVDVSKNQQNVSVYIETMKSNADFAASSFNYQFTSSDNTNYSISAGWGQQHFITDESVGSVTGHNLTGPAPASDGEVKELLLVLITQIDNGTFGTKGFISAETSVRLRFVGYDPNKVSSGKTIVTSSILRGYPNVYATSRTLLAYNVDSGNSVSFSNDNDGGYCAGNEDFPVYSHADAAAYIDVSKYSRLEDTDIFFVHDVSQLCGAGKDDQGNNTGWSWANVSLWSSDPSLSYSINKDMLYTIANGDCVNNLYYRPFKVLGNLPSKGNSVTITLQSLCNARGWAQSSAQLFYNSSAELALTIYAYDKTSLKEAIDTQVGSSSLYTQASWNAYAAALSEAQTVYATTTIQSNYDAKETALRSAIEGLVRVATITWKNYDNSTLETDYNVAFGTTPEFNGSTPVKPATAQYTYTFSGWSPAVESVSGDATYTAQFSESTNKYTVTWKNYNGTVLETDENVPYGTTPVFNGSTPVKPATAQYTYTFSGWSPEVSGITGNTVYTAQFTETLNKYTVVWKNENGTVLETDENVPYGTTPEYNSATPVKEGTAQFTYTFDAWSPNVSEVTGNVEYTATYTSTVNKYIVKFMNGDMELQSAKYSYGTTPVYLGNTPVKPADAQYTYTFSGWSPAIEPVTGDATYTAQFSNGTNAYTITFKNGDTVLQSSYWDYGQTPAYSGTLTKDFDSVNHYTFSGWDPSITSVTGAAEYSAQFTSEVHSLTYRYDSTDHWQVCDCGYTTAKSAHVLDENGRCVCGYVSTQKADYTAVEAAKSDVPAITVYYTDESVSALTNAIKAVEYDLYIGRQSDVDAMASNINTAVAGLTVKQYNVSVSGEGSTISQTLPEGSHYYLATVRAPKTNSNGDYFTYWKDGNGEIVGTYRNYSFYVVSDVTLTPVFTAPSAYETARQDAVISSRALDAKTNSDGTVVVFAEHSISSTEGSINGHGVIVTTNASLANEGSMVRGSNNEELHDFMARSSSATLTGIVEAHAQLTGSTVWVRTYVIDKNGDEKYGEIKSFAIDANSDSAEEDIMLDSETFDLTAENEGNDAPAAVDDSAEENTDIVSTVIDMLKNIITRIINYIKFALSILK